MANNPYVNKVVFGSATLVDLTGTTATADKILSGYGAFGADGAWMDGTATGGGSGGGHLTQDQDGFLVIPPDGSGGGGGSWQTVFEGSVTTTSSSASIQGLDYNELSNSIKVTFNGVEYSCEKNADDSFGATYDESTQTYDWSEYPFAIYPNSSGTSGYIDTETAGTYSLKIEVPAESGSSDFSTAEVTLTAPANNYYIPNIIAYTIEAFGDEFTNVVGVKATDNNDNVVAFIKPVGTKSISANGTGIDVSEYASVDVSVPSGQSNLQSKTKTYTPTESAQTESVSADSGYDGLDTVSISVGAISNTYVGSGITRRSSTDLTASGATVTVPSGYYSAQASKAVASGTAGTPTATKGSVSNHQISVTPSVTNTTGYITGSTKTGTAVTVSASELVSGSDTVTSNDTYDVTNLAELVVNVSGGGSVTVTDEANATGTTCVITSGGSPTPSGIPLNTELIDFTKLTEDYAINSSGEAVATQWYCASDYTAVDPSMTFSYTGCRWYYIGVYDSSKEVLRTIYIYNDGTADPDNTNLANGTLSGSELTGASYVRITGVAVQSQYRLSLIRTA